MEHRCQAAAEDRGRWHRSAQEADIGATDGKARGLNGVISPEMEVELTSD